MARKAPLDPRALLWDMDQAALAIAGVVKDVDEDSYAASALVHSAVAFRNQLIHGYALVDHATVWGVVQHDLPGLRAAVAQLLAEIPVQSIE